MTACLALDGIYIPLCFYFIVGSLPLCLVAVTNLHSTMLLLYRMPRSSLRPVSMSFTFHYASTLSSFSRSALWILIVFTFHYASTLSECVSDEFCCGCEFTFHYASTLSYHPADSLFHLSDLHSTMLLLYLSAFRPLGLYTFNLHSTMLLLYHSFSRTAYCSVTIYIPLCFYFICYPAF